MSLPSSSGPRTRHSYGEGKMDSLTGNRTRLLWPCATVAGRMDPFLPRVDGSHRWHIAAVATRCVATRNSYLCLTCVHTLQRPGMRPLSVSTQKRNVGMRARMASRNSRISLSQSWLPYILARISKYRGILAQSKNCEARETAVASERL
jgi:ribosomal protein L34